MDIRFDYNLKKRCLRSGSVLVMVVVLTVLLALVGVMFVVMARMDNMSASGVSNNADLHAGVEAVVDKIKSLMVEDLFQAAPFQPDERVEIGEMQDSPATGIDRWLASLEPVRKNGNTYRWPYISDLYGSDVYGDNFNSMGNYLEDISDDTSKVSRTQVKAKIIFPNDVVMPVYLASDFSVFNKNGAPADADGDGVSDSRWFAIPGMRSTKGKDIYAAVRIIDNCAMLNLNTAHSKDKVPLDESSYLAEASYLSAVDYERFLRGREASLDTPEDRDNIRKARKRNGFVPAVDTFMAHHDQAIMHIENPGVNYSLFDIGDELEIRNRFMLTSKVEARFEQKNIANYTLDAGGGKYGALSIPRTNKMERDGSRSFTKWKWRVNHENFDNLPKEIDNPQAWKYDRRHVCTFYSFDRNLRKKDYPLVDVVGDITSPPPPAVPTPWTIDLTQRDYVLASKGDVFIPAYGAAGINDITSNTLRSRKNILHLLYALRAYFIDNDPVGATDKDIVADAARRAAQYVVNMIDYADDPAMNGPFGGPNYGNQKNDNITYINRSVIQQLILEASGNAIDVGLLPVDNPYDFGLGLDDVAGGLSETVYGYERQPFISELTSKIESGSVTEFSIELCNPYKNPNGVIQLDKWQLVVGSVTYDLSSYLEVSAATAAGLGYLTIHDLSMAASILSGGKVILQRPDPANTGLFISVDVTEAPQASHVVPSVSVDDGDYVSKRDTTGWRFVDNSKYDETDNTKTVDAANGISIPAANGFQLPVANDPVVLRTLRGLEGVTFLGNGDPNGTITQQIGQMAPGDDEFDIRFDVENDTLLEYISLITRPEGGLPGRINVNTATMEVIRAAIPEVTPWWDNAVDKFADDLANEIIKNRPYSNIRDLLAVDGFKDFEDNTIADNVGDLEIEDDFEERDWILSRLANIFTVRSDTFTAYILIRLGVDGPQKRMIAILDRTGVSSPSDRPRLVALHPVPDPR